MSAVYRFVTSLQNFSAIGYTSTVIRMRSLLLIGVLALTGFALVHTAFGGKSVSRGLVEVHFLDVGQGDATFIQSPSGTQVLIDGGADSGVLREIAKILGFFDRTIDVVVATHPDQDHIGGLVDVLYRYEVAHIVVTENVSATPVAEAFYTAVEKEGATLHVARSGQIYDLGYGSAGSTTLSILFPDRDVSGLESNASSIVAKLSYGDFDVLLTGDSPKSIETYLVARDGGALESEVLKAGHHGSDTSSSELFLKTVDPLIGVFSAGRDNRYGHPHKTVTDLFAKLGITTKNTADDGSVLVVSDGTSFELR